MARQSVYVTIPQISTEALTQVLTENCDQDGDCRIWRNDLRGEGQPLVFAEGRKRQLRLLVYRFLSERGDPQASRCYTTCRKARCLEPSHLTKDPPTRRERITLTKPILEDLLKTHTTRMNDCWIWNSTYGSDNTPRLPGATYTGKGSIRPHIAKLILGKDLKLGQRCKASCGNALCVRPDHIEIVTERILREEGWLPERFDEEKKFTRHELEEIASEILAADSLRTGDSHGILTEGDGSAMELRVKREIYTEEGTADYTITNLLSADGCRVFSRAYSRFGEQTLDSDNSEG